jgi:hypothetical protein
VFSKSFRENRFVFPNNLKSIKDVRCVCINGVEFRNGDVE